MHFLSDLNPGDECTLMSWHEGKIKVKWTGLTCLQDGYCNTMYILQDNAGKLRLSMSETWIEDIKRVGISDYKQEHKYYSTDEELFDWLKMRIL